MADLDSDKIIEGCVDQLKSGDYSTAAGRRAANRKAGECAAEGACQFYSKGLMPTGICGPIGDVVAKWVGDAFESVFGSGDYDKEMRRRAVSAARQQQAGVVGDYLKSYDLLMDVKLASTLAAMITAWDSAVPGDAGRLGGGGRVVTMEANSYAWHLDRDLWEQPIRFNYYTGNTLPAGYLLRDLGAPIELRQVGNGVPFWSAPRVYVDPVSTDITVETEVTQPEHTVRIPGFFTTTIKPPPVRTATVTDDLKEAGEYLTKVSEDFYPQWVKAFDAAGSRSEGFITTAASRRQAELVAKERAQGILDAQAVGAARSATLNKWLLAGGAAAVLGAWALRRA